MRNTTFLNRLHVRNSVRIIEVSDNRGTDNRGRGRTVLQVPRICSEKKKLARYGSAKILACQCKKTWSGSAKKNLAWQCKKKHGLAMPGPAVPKNNHGLAVQKKTWPGSAKKNLAWQCKKKPWPGSAKKTLAWQCKKNPGLAEQKLEKGSLPVVLLSVSLLFLQEFLSKFQDFIAHGRNAN